MSDIEDKLDDLLRRAQSEVADVDLFASPPPNEDCPICFLPYPHGEFLSAFQSCCGKVICGGCMVKHTMPKGICAFCRTPIDYFRNDLKAVEKHMQKQNPRAFLEMAMSYRNGVGVPQKALELYSQAANLGYPKAYWWIAEYYREGLSRLSIVEEKSKCRAFLEVAAKKGSTMSHIMLAQLNEEKGDVALAISHHKVAACAGLQSSLTALMKAFKDDRLPKEELEHCLRAFQASDGEMKSKDRDAYVAFMREQWGGRDFGSGEMMRRGIGCIPFP